MGGMRISGVSAEAGSPLNHVFRRIPALIAYNLGALSCQPMGSGEDASLVDIMIISAIVCKSISGLWLRRTGRAT
jgi:hypothetical protein